MASRPRSVAPALDAGVLHSPPATHLLDLLGLGIGIAGAFLAHPRDFSLRVIFRTWARRMMGRYGSENLILNLGVKKLLLVGGRDLSRQILESPPTSQQYVTGSPKRDSMAFLAPHALTISDGQEWGRLRPLNERVLESGRPHEFRQAFLSQVDAAFTASPETIEDIRAAMGRTMLGIVFGAGLAPQTLADDVQALFQLVQQPVKRLLLGPWARRRRARFYEALRRAWRESASSPQPSLVTLMHREAQGFGEEQVLEQIPHWMFTFTGSGTDLLVRTLTLLTSEPAALEAARREIGAAGPLDRADTVDRLPYLEASLRESARLYPPVTRTFHRAAASVVAGQLRLPPGLEILHSFPLIGGPESVSADSRRFRPERWLSPDTAASAADFDPFLHGARHCPGRELIMFVCKSALAILIGRYHLVVTAPPAGEALPPAFPTHGIRFRRS
jgi:cytochrome P450